MNSHNAKSDLLVIHEKVVIKTEDHDAHVLNSQLVESPELLVLEDSDMGSDPYNSTGSHVIIPRTGDPGD